MTERASIELIHADWAAPENVNAVVTTRAGGVSPAPYQSFNLAAHVGDAADCVTANRRILCERLGFEPTALHWLRQMHSTTVVEAAPVIGAEGKVHGPVVAGDAWVCFAPRQLCVVLTADCLPIFLCDLQGTCVGVVHAGWRGLSRGVLEATIEALDRPPSQLMAWLGPAISAHAYPVGDEVRDAFVSDGCEADVLAFTPDNTGAWRADLYALAANRLRRRGVAFSGARYCTFYDAERFYSYRRDGCTGRMASLIWMS